MMRRWQLIFATLILLVLAAPWLLTVRAVVGQKKLPIEVLVVDTDVPCAIPGAKVTLFRGPMSLFESDLAITFKSPSTFLPDAQSPDTKSQVTDSTGRCSFMYPFSASWTEGAFGYSGYVTTSDVWLHISADDRPTTVVPLDRQSSLGRDIKDDTPLFVTVALNKAVGK
jgi:hypothetical protein